MGLLGRAKATLLATCLGVMPTCKKADRPADEAEATASPSTAQRNKAQRILKSLPNELKVERTETLERRHDSDDSAEENGLPDKKESFGQAADDLEKAIESIEGFADGSDEDAATMIAPLALLRSANKRLERYKADYPVDSKERKAMEDMYEVSSVLGYALLADSEDVRSEGEESRLMRMTKQRLPVLQEAQLVLNEMESDLR